MEFTIWAWCLSACVKLLLSPSYRSTDFEVHRHWLALTRSLPLASWYSDASSVWTLDYPPLFAHATFLLSLPASLLDSNITSLASHNYSSPACLYFLRLSVVSLDLSLLIAFLRFRRRLHNLAVLLVLWSPSLLMVDHIHFQYNGYFLGLLLLSLSYLTEGKDLTGGVVFAALVCSKHLFMVAAPLYFVYLLRHYCRGVWLIRVLKFAAMGSSVGAVFVATFGPFLYYSQMPQLLHRLFPFGRGLCHAYWAPNFWALYIVVDKGLAFVLVKLGFEVYAPKASFTGGLVGDSSPFAVLPQVTPIITFLLVILAMFPCLVKAFKNPKPKHIVRWAAYAYSCGFIFGWHVHEKASLHFTIPLGLIAMDSIDDARHFFLLSIVSCYSMFPLFFEPQEFLIKVLLLATYSTLTWAGFTSYFRRVSGTEGDRNSGNESKSQVSGTEGDRNSGNESESHAKRNDFIGPIGICYLMGLVGVEIWSQFLHPLIFGDRYPFIPLMLISIYCAIGMMYSWFWQLRKILDCT